MIANGDTAVDLVDCVPMTDELIRQQSDEELEAGNWRSGRYAWKLENVSPIVPVPLRGHQGLWETEIPSIPLFDWRIIS
ncbi:hypothetical protein BI308_23150 [Roseofilum reptotaenium AO1-A]|uniref:Uncharacterized protein n=1 Tax=Roseofilum reptotaenium AO1-A TaxID=1925591 RepID=A0A1L9QKL2_9CYAN|nr:hypothetical protein BI308_23150 [Roseofilum reptotaenium AO1-A]